MCSTVLLLLNNVITTTKHAPKAAFAENGNLASYITWATSTVAWGGWKSKKGDAQGVKSYSLYEINNSGIIHAMRRVGKLKDVWVLKPPPCPKTKSGTQIAIFHSPAPQVPNNTSTAATVTPSSSTHARLSPQPAKASSSAHSTGNINVPNLSPSSPPIGIRGSNTTNILRDLHDICIINTGVVPSLAQFMAYGANGSADFASALRQPIPHR